MLSARSLEPKINSKTHKLEDMLSIDCGENLSIEIYLVSELASVGDGDKIIRKALERQYKPPLQ